MDILYSGKVWRGKVWQIESFRKLQKKVWRINTSANKLSTNLDGVSLANRG